MTTEFAVIHPIDPPSFITKRQLYYAKDDSCIATTSSQYTKAHDLEEFSSLFKKTRRCSHTLVDVSFELEVMRNSLGKMTLQRRTDRRYSQDSTLSEGSNASAGFSLSEEEIPYPLSPKVNHLLWELENCLVKIQQQNDSNGFYSSTESHGYSLKGVGEPISSVSAQVAIKSASMTAFTTSMSSVPVGVSSGSNRSGSETLNDKYSENSDDSFGSFQKFNANRNNITVSEVYIAATLAGWVLKLNSTSFFSLKSWKKRFLVLTPTTLFRFKSSAPETIVDEYLELTPETIACVTDRFNGKRWVLEITSPSKPSWYIQTESLDELKTWLNALKASVIRAKYCSRGLPSSGSFSIPLVQQDATNITPFVGNSRRDSASTVPLTRPKTLHALNGHSKSMSALPPQPPIPGYLPPVPPSDHTTGGPRLRTTRAPSAPAIFGASLTKITRVGSFTRRLQTNHKDTSQPSSKRNSVILPTLNEDA